jgi:hypothetical protein
LLKSYNSLKSSSLYHPSKAKPFFMGITGIEIGILYETSIGLIMLPSFVSKVTTGFEKIEEEKLIQFSAFLNKLRDSDGT